MLRIIQILVLLLISMFSIAENLTEKKLIGTWVPSGEIHRDESVRSYKLIVNEDMSANYISIYPEGKEENISLKCDYKPSSSQDSIFIYYCYLNHLHLITLSLGGWKSESGQLLYGYEYWLGHPKPGQIHGGLPVSLSMQSKL